MLTILSHVHPQLCLHNSSSVHSRTVQSEGKLYHNAENVHVGFSDDVNICRLLPWKSHSHRCLTSCMTWMLNKSWPASPAVNCQEILVHCSEQQEEETHWGSLNSGCWKIYIYLWLHSPHICQQISPLELELSSFNNWLVWLHWIKTPVLDIVVLFSQCSSGALGFSL